MYMNNILFVRVKTSGDARMRAVSWQSGMTRGARSCAPWPALALGVGHAGGGEGHAARVVRDVGGAAAERHGPRGQAQAELALSGAAQLKQTK